MAAGEHDSTRLDAFSDAVFGFAITLLVVSLEVPDSFDALLQVMKGLPVFAATFAILLMIWQEHHTLFRRFPSSDGPTIWLNGALLFVVLSYIYPLKFLFAGVVGMRFAQGASFIRLEQMATLMIVYGCGFATIFLLFAAMYWRAARRVADPETRHDARVMIGHSFVYVGVAAVSMALAVFGGFAGFGGTFVSAYAGLAYGLIGPGQVLYHAVTARYWKAPVAKAEALQSAAPEAASTPGNERGSTP